jgi:hypothetical protein
MRSRRTISESSKNQAPNPKETPNTIPNDVRRLRIILTMVAAMVSIAICVGIYYAMEPKYEGRTLSEWTDDVVRNAWVRDRDRDDKWTAARSAVGYIGTDAIPFLSRWSVARDSAIKEKVISWLRAHKSFRMRLRTARERRLEAYYGFLLVGDKGKSASPLFVTWTKDADASRRWWGLHCLENCDADKETLRPVLLRLIHDGDKDVHSYATKVLNREFPEEAEPEWLNNKDPLQVKSGDGVEADHLQMK